MDVTEDEVSAVLRHFRPRPGFVCGAVGGEHEKKWIKKSSSVRGQQRQQRINRGYSSVQFVAPSAASSSGSNVDVGCNMGTDCGGGKLRLTYMHVHALNPKEGNSTISTTVFLAFEITVNAKSVMCVQCSTPDASLSARIKERLDQRCRDLSCHPSVVEAGDSSSGSADCANIPSLFLITSQLLQFLSVDFPLYEDDIKAMPSLQGETLSASIDRLATVHTKSTATIQTLLDMQTLLLRCAAAGRNRSKVCAPVPVEFVSAAAGDGDAVAHLAFAASDQMYLHGFRGEEHKDQQILTQQQQQLGLPEARTLLSFFLSLPWIGGSRLKRDVKADDANSKLSKSKAKSNSTSKSIEARLCLDIGKALGDPSPTFSRHAAKYGTIQAYHGTKLESAWSILNYGLQNLSYNSLSQNGAMMGDGVYLSSSRQVAEYFAQSAAERPPPALALAFQHESLLHLLLCANVDVSILDPLETYSIKCLPVFEATIIKPPPPGADDGTTRKNDAITAAATRQEGKYYVCSDGEFVRITKLHLTFELSKKSSIWQTLPRVPLSLIVLLVAMLWLMQ